MEGEILCDGGGERHGPSNSPPRFSFWRGLLVSNPNSTLSLTSTLTLEVAPLTESMRKADVVAVVDSKCYRIIPDLLPQKTVDRLSRRASGYIRYKCSLELLQSIFLFQDLTEEELWAVGKVCQRTTYQKDQYIVREGAEGVNLFIIAVGSCMATTHNTTDDDAEAVILREYDRGEYFGEIAFFTGQKRKCDIIATSGVDMILLNNRVLEALPSKVIARLQEGMLEYPIYHLMHPKTGCLAALPKFEGLDAVAKWSLAKLCDEKTFDEGEILCLQKPDPEIEVHRRDLGKY